MIFPIEENNIKHKRGCPKGQSLFSLSKNQPMPPLCKGRWQKSMIFDGGVVKVKFNICKKQPRIWNNS